MKNYKIKIKLDSDTLIGSAEGYGATIDSDVVFDNCGLPYIPAKRVKGILKNAAFDLKNILDNAKINLNIDIDKIFGKIGTTGETSLFLSNLCLINLENTKDCIEFNKISFDSVIDYFTSVRRQTSMETNKRVAKKHSLRTLRIVKKGFEFIGDIQFNEEYMALFALICQTARKMGTARNRGLGNITVTLLNPADNISLNETGIKLLEDAKCTN